MLDVGLEDDDLVVVVGAGGTVVVVAAFDGSKSAPMVTVSWIAESTSSSYRTSVAPIALARAVAAR